MPKLTLTNGIQTVLLLIVIVFFYASILGFAFAESRQTKKEFPLSSTIYKDLNYKNINKSIGISNYDNDLKVLNEINSKHNALLNINLNSDEKI